MCHMCHGVSQYDGAILVKCSEFLVPNLVQNGPFNLIKSMWKIEYVLESMGQSMFCEYMTLILSLYLYRI